jgi:hypothetical protein
MTIEAQRTATLKRDLTHLLERKRAIDMQNVTTNYAQSYDDWLRNAVELLLRSELERLK